MLKLKASDYIFSSAFFHLKKKNSCERVPFFFFFFFAQKLSQKKSSKQIDWPIPLFQPRPANPSLLSIKRVHFFCNLQNSFFLLFSLLLVYLKKKLIIHNMVAAAATKKTTPAKKADHPTVSIHCST